LSLIVQGGDEDSVPLSNIPSSLKFFELRELLKVASIKIAADRTWDQTEFFLDANYWYPLPNQVSLASAGVLNGQTIFMAYKNSESVTSVRVLVSGHTLVMDNLPAYASIGGLKNQLKGKLSDTKANFSIRRMKDSEPLPPNFLLNRLERDEILVLEGSGGLSVKSKDSFALKSVDNIASKIMGSFALQNSDNTVPFRFKSEFWNGFSFGVTICVLLCVVIKWAFSADHLMPL